MISGSPRRRPSFGVRQRPDGAEGEPPDLRSALLAAADRLLRRRGVAGLTTREIAREAGCSDGALYVHFTDKSDLLACVCERWLPDLVAVLGDLVNRVGAATVAENIEAIAGTALRAFNEMVPLTYAIAGDPDLLARHREFLRAADKGPHRGVQAIGAYLAAEQRVGRVRDDADCPMAASMLIGSCWHRAAMLHYFGAPTLPLDDATYAAQLAATLAAALEPGTTTTRRLPSGGQP